MNPEKAQAIRVHADAIAALLYEEANQEELKNLAGILTIRVIGLSKDTR